MQDEITGSIKDGRNEQAKVYSWKWPQGLRMAYDGRIGRRRSCGELRSR